MNISNHVDLILIGVHSQTETNKWLSVSRIGQKDWSWLFGLDHHISPPLKGVWLCPGSAVMPNSAFEHRSCVAQIACCQKPFFKRGTIMLNQRWCFTECFPPSHVPLIWFSRECDWWRSSRDVERVRFQNCNSSQLWNRQSTCSLNLHKNLGISKPLALKPHSQFQMFLWERPDNRSSGVKHYGNSVYQQLWTVESAVIMLIQSLFVFCVACRPLTTFWSALVCYLTFCYLTIPCLNILVRINIWKIKMQFRFWIITLWD